MKQKISKDVAKLKKERPDYSYGEEENGYYEKRKTKNKRNSHSFLKLAQLFNIFAGKV